MSTNLRIEKKSNDHHYLGWTGKNWTKDEVSAGWLLSVSPGFPVNAFPFITFSSWSTQDSTCLSQLLSCSMNWRFRPRHPVIPKIRIGVSLDPPGHLMRRKILKGYKTYTHQVFGGFRMSRFVFVFFTCKFVGEKLSQWCWETLTNKRLRHFFCLPSCFGGMLVKFSLKKLWNATKFSGILSPYIRDSIAPYSKYPNVWSQPGGIQPTILQALLLLLKALKNSHDGNPSIFL